jgi:hypothetical protein
VTTTRPRLAAVTITAAWLGLGACGAGEQPAPVDVPADTPPERPPAMADEKMTLARQVLAAKADLARRSGVSADDIEVVEARQVTWPDASLGCPEPGMMYAQVLTPGVLVVLSFHRAETRYHAGLSEVPAPCPAGRAREPAAVPPGR